MKKYSLIPGIATAAFMIMTACTGKTEVEKPEKVIPVKVMEIAVSTATGERNYVGTVEESLAISLSFSGMGMVEQVLVAEGQKVKKGQLLATLNTATVENSYQAMRAQLEQAQDAYDRLAKVHANGSLPDVKFKEVEAGLQQAKSMAAISKKSLDDCRLLAPCDGVIAVRSVEAGTNATPGITAFKLVSIDRVLVKISVPENEIGSISEGLNTNVTVPALDNAVFTGKIEMKGVEANTLSHTYEAKIAIANPQKTLMPGMVCKVRLVQDDATAEIVVPNGAVQIASDNRHFVWLTVETGRAPSLQAKRCFVTTGNLTNDGIVVKNGLQTGDRLIVEGYRKISEGMSISIKN